MIPPHRWLWLVAVAGAMACAQSEGARQAISSDSSAATPATSGVVTADSVALARADSSRIQGNPNASLWIVEISDFQCPFCKQWHDSTYQRIVQTYVQSGRARFAYLNMPLPNHANAMPAAEAAMCAGLQGRFWPMHDELFETQERWASQSDPWPTFIALARGLEIDAAAFESCADSDRILPLVQADAARAMQAGVRSTPSFLIGGVMLSGAYPFEEMRRVVDSVLAAGGR